MAESCSTCKYIEKDYTTSRAVFRCRRYPPTVLQLRGIRSIFPYVNVDTWCGEYQGVRADSCAEPVSTEPYLPHRPARMRDGVIEGHDRTRRDD